MMNDINGNPSLKPKVSNFHQQTLPSWNPLIMINSIFYLFGVLGAVFIVIGIGLLLSSMSVNEYTIDYTDCAEYIRNNYSGRVCSKVLNKNLTKNFMSCSCKIDFQLKQNFNGQVYFYYLLENFYQNHRRYYGSRDNKQLVGKSLRKVSGSCNPLGYKENDSIVYNYAPCGLIANSLFNDSFSLIFKNGSKEIPVSMTTKGIAWSSDKNMLFGKPTDWTNTLKPINWPYTALQRNNDSYSGDEELIVWMRAAPLATFKKLNRIIKHDSEPFLKGLPAGYYELSIEYAYPVSVFSGRKMVVLSTTTAMGGKNHSMGILYIGCGSLHELIALVFFLLTFFKKEKESSFSGLPLITSLSTPESYGLTEVAYPGSSSTNR